MASAKALLHALTLEKLDRDLFRSVKLWTPPSSRGTFGGQIVALALEAARDTVPDSEEVVNSMHSRFLNKGNSMMPIYYRVKRLRDGKSTCVRLVEATQDGNVIFVTTVSFHKQEKPGLRHSFAMPETVPPKKAVPSASVMQVLSSGTKLKENVDKEKGGRFFLDIRYCDPGTLEKPLKSTGGRRRRANDRCCAVW